MTESKPPASKSSVPPPSSIVPVSKKKKNSAAQAQRDLQTLSRKQASERPPLDMSKIITRVGIALMAIWAIALIVPTWYPKALAGVITLGVIGAAIWFRLYIQKSEKLGAILKGADTDEGRKEALATLERDFKKGDTQATIAKAQLEMQDDPRKALTTLEQVELTKVLGPVADQVRALRAMLHLSLGEASAARELADKLDLGKQQDAKTRAMFATVAGEAWARTGNAKKAIETLELFNPEDPEFADSRTQMYRARAFAYASVNDTKSMTRMLKKLSDVNPHLLGMFVGKKIHPLLEKEAKQMLMRSGAMPRKMVRQRM
ncbi:MAG: hypothetical protein ABI461_13330 [Polyangiaceae bacterium]